MKFNSEEVIRLKSGKTGINIVDDSLLKWYHISLKSLCRSNSIPKLVFSPY